MADAAWLAHEAAVHPELPLGRAVEAIEAGHRYEQQLAGV